MVINLNIKIAALESELSKYRTPKNSGNSSLPPSSDFAAPKRNQSLREKSGKFPGGQKGHEGATLEFNSAPDKVVNHSPCTCSVCGMDLDGLDGTLVDKRQVVDLPPVQPVYTEHQVYRKVCSCGKANEGSFPPGINAPIQYGGGIGAMATYLHARQYIPYERMAEFFKHAMNLPVSPGTLNNIVHRFAEKASPTYNAIKAAVEQAQYVGSDETGCKVNGEKYWFWTWQNNTLTFITCSKSRGAETVELAFPEGLPGTILGSDRWAAQLKCIAKEHQICMAHLLRDLNYVEQLHDSQWAKDLKVVIRDALLLKGELDEKGYKPDVPARAAIENRLQQALVQNIPGGHHAATTLQKSLSKIQQYILRFLYYPFVPADNNGSERAVRNVKVKQKVSGQFKSRQGADDFAIIRSIIDTAIKTGKDVYSVLFSIANLEQT